MLKIKLKRASVRVPKLKLRRRKAKLLEGKTEENIPASVLVNILIKAAVDKAKQEKKEKPTEDRKPYAIIKERKSTAGGYGNVPKFYGISPHSSYVDYGKLFSYIGNFRAQNAYENFVSETPTELMNKILEQGSKFYLVDREVIDDGVRSIKYFTFGILLGEPSAVPMGGINSADWEKFKLWKLVDYVMFNLKMSTL